jgi:alkanesulfonate monooxygenase SsuD/methylene tetrahydromethanopterin reductase-like flavin-dependent oxidoreductase (luciferase family)
MKRVADFGDVWHPLGFQPVDDAHFSAHEHEFTESMQTGGTTPDLLRRGLDYINDLAAKSGRDMSGLQAVVMAGSTLNVSGSDDRVIDSLGRYIEAGATGFSIAASGDSADEVIDSLARFAEQVVPQV